MQDQFNNNANDPMNTESMKVYLGTMREVIREGEENTAGVPHLKLHRVGEALENIMGIPYDHASPQFNEAFAEYKNALIDLNAYVPYMDIESRRVFMGVRDKMAKINSERDAGTLGNTAPPVAEKNAPQPVQNTQPRHFKF